MNQPGRAEGNWRWRCTDAMLSAPIFRDLAHLTETADRVGALHPPRVERPSAR
jgi:4-alpha-glucanotransferase